MNQNVGSLTQTQIVSIWKRVYKTNTCWFWQGTKDPDGYGKVRFGEGNYFVHRLTYQLLNGETELLILHRCNKRNCCNPSHLYAGTNQDNMNDRDLDGTTSKGSKHFNSKLTEAQVADIKLLYSNSLNTQQELATKYNVTRQTIWAIVHGKWWKEVA